jgi:L-alanine-DL-glutamate epimerase-like enolase superfamily enzyme
VEITDLSVDVIEVPRRTGFVCQHAILRLRTDDGVEGIGEMSDFSHLPRYSIDVEDLVTTLSAELVGANPFDVAGLNRKLADMFPETMYYYEKGNFIRCGVDLALHDLLGKALGVNASELLGGRVREKIKVCYPIFRHRSMREVPASLETVRTLHDEGFDVFRLYAGADPEADEAFLEGVRKEHGDDIKIKSLDFSHLLSWKEALQVTRRLQPYDVMLIESPAPRNDFAGLRNFRMSVELPVSEHVWSFQQLHEMITRDAVDVLNIAPIFIGGLSAAKKAAAAAEVVGIGCLLGTTQELGIGTAAQAILGAGLTNLTTISDPTGPRLYTDDIVSQPVRYRDGFLEAPARSTPGLGVEVDWEKVERLRVDSFSWKSQGLHQVQDRTAG